jgi:hypothetical protein
MKIIEVVVRILRTARRTSWLSFIALIGIAGKWCQMHALNKGRASAESHLVDDRVVRQRECQSSVIRNTARVGLIAENLAAVAIR